MQTSFDRCFLTPLTCICFSPWYAEGASGRPKDIVIVVDKSGSMSKYIDKSGSMTMMNIAMEATTVVIQTLNPNDRVVLQLIELFNFVSSVFVQ